MSGGRFGPAGRGLRVDADREMIYRFFGFFGSGRAEDLGRRPYFPRLYCVLFRQTRAIKAPRKSMGLGPLKRYATIPSKKSLDRALRVRRRKVVSPLDI